MYFSCSKNLIVFIYIPKYEALFIYYPFKKTRKWKIICNFTFWYIYPFWGIKWQHAYPFIYVKWTFSHSNGYSSKIVFWWLLSISLHRCNKIIGHRTIAKFHYKRISLWDFPYTWNFVLSSRQLSDNGTTKPKCMDIRDNYCQSFKEGKSIHLASVLYDYMHLPMFSPSDGMITLEDVNLINDSTSPAQDKDLGLPWEQCCLLTMWGLWQEQT